MSITNPHALAAEIRKLAGELALSADALLLQLDQPPVIDNSSPFKRPDGRLTETGITVLYADLAAQKLTNEEVAAKHSISLSGVVKRKAMWKAGKR